MSWLNLAMAGGSGGGWDVTTFLTSLATQLEQWGSIIIVLIGIVMIIWSIYKLATGLLSQGRQDISWFKIGIAFLVGGAFVAAGIGGAFNFAKKIAAGGKTTIEDLGSTILFLRGLR